MWADVVPSSLLTHATMQCLVCGVSIQLANYWPFYAAMQRAAFPGHPRCTPNSCAQNQCKFQQHFVTGLSGFLWRKCIFNYLIGLSVLLNPMTGLRTIIIYIVLNGFPRDTFPIKVTSVFKSLLT